MSDERFDKLLEVMLEVKGEVEKLKVGQNEMNEKLNRIEDNLDLLAQKNWNNEKDIHRMKKLIGVE